MLATPPISDRSKGLRSAAPPQPVAKEKPAPVEPKVTPEATRSQSSKLPVGDRGVPQKVLNETQDQFLQLILCPPRYLSVEVANNAWMKQMKGDDKKVNIDKAMAQFFTLYGLLAQDAMAYLLPPNPALQDEVYISNAGMFLPHLKEKTFILSNFTAPGRPGEERVLSYFLKMTPYKQYFCPFRWEGEAETKWLRDDIYFFGYGMRSDVKAFKWMEEKFGCRGVYIRETDPLRYHLDCSIFPINRECVLLADDLPAAERKAVEKVAEIVPVSKRDSQLSITNAVRVGSVIFNATSISEMKKSDKEYDAEVHKNETLEKICADKGLSLVWVNLSELGKSGAALSCCVLHLTRIAYPA